MKSLIFTLLIFTGFLREQNIKEDYNKYSYTKEIFSYRPVCPVSVEKDRDVETSDALFVQEKPKPIVLLIPEDIRCDGLLCPIPPIESQLKRPDPELYKVIIWDFLWIDPYIKLLMAPTENTSRLKGEIMDLMSLEKLVVLLDLLCLCWYYRTTSKKKKDSSSAETECKKEQSPIIKHQSDKEIEYEEAEEIRESALSLPTDCSYFFQHEPQESKSKKKCLCFNVRKSFCHSQNKTKKNGTGYRKEQNKFSHLFLNFIRQSIQRDTVCEEET